MFSVKIQVDTLCVPIGYIVLELSAKTCFFKMAKTNWCCTTSVNIHLKWTMTYSKDNCRPYVVTPLFQLAIWPWHLMTYIVLIWEICAPSQVSSWYFASPDRTYSPWQKSCRLGTNWPEVPLKYISNQYFFYKKWHILIATAFGIMFWCKTKLYSNVHSLLKPIESIFAKTKVLSPCQMMHPILD